MSAIPAIQTFEQAQEGEGSVSPASALSAHERIFCDVFVANGGKANEAAIAAGIEPDKAAVQACRMLCRKRVADYLTALAMRFAHTALPIAVKALIDIASDEMALRKDRIKAATSLLEHGGMAAPKGGVQVNVGVQVNGEQAQRLIGSVWNAKQARLSGIADGMSDTFEDDLHELERLAIGPPADPPGGDQLQGPAAGTGPVPVSGSTTSPIPDVSQRDPFRAAIDDDSKGEDDA